MWGAYHLKVPGVPDTREKEDVGCSHCSSAQHHFSLRQQSEVLPKSANLHPHGPALLHQHPHHLAIGQHCQVAPGVALSIGPVRELLP